ncbi:hypothetical protein OCGS_1687 [Oceaniovalibus guishaninsula JLT2003]|uniref:Entericidin EcnA/B family protein n=1 Tax=Oceaniovalibus guishaninsula JLT2003 TaxID=1231392 RepID=K2GNH6_9RHOB|nr:hypothetical protein [Oceaniovalibus guishaninsula]EKE44171.1 hypothetical protein OCGS_1687 [Oceaniovalibus guishaninsula JLT2003]
MKNKTATFVLLAAAALALAGCNTAVGVAKDTWGGTKFVGNQIMGDDS